ncbi:S1 RNA-binding domain-containing protein [uncultured Tenacibaculum sp.]|uniref:S1 RNA-binding domain-containing protein n=1 Tax=uncultured Tenacibaculum sp. TaxID=174713 RepID=UPI00261CB56D|nr:S1 RNA-binding domain-containing protein [uncultured Tenacibaculum sp.]
MKEKLSQYETLKTVYKVGHPISVKVIQHNGKVNNLGSYRILVETEKGVKGFLDLKTSPNQKEKRLLKTDEFFTAIIKNYSSDNNMLYLSIDLEDLKESSIDSYKKFYTLINEIKEGTELTGTVTEIQPFGLFVDIGQEFIGLIDIGHTSFNQGAKLPFDNSRWPKNGDSIKCIVSYYRFDNKQFGLGWIPERKAHNKV